MQNTNTQTVLNNATEITSVVWQSIDSLLTSIVSRLPYLIAGSIILILAWMLSGIIKKIFWTATKRTKLDERLKILFSRLLVVFVYVLGVFTALTVIVPSFAFGDFIAGLGLTSLAIGFATKDILNHLISGVLILWQQPFRIGDYIILKDEEGWVDSIGVRATSLRRSNGEMIFVPNGDIYSGTFKLRKAGSSYPISLKFSIGYDSNFEEAKRITRVTLQKSKSVVENPAPKVVITDLNNEGIRLTANFRINSNESRPLEAFDEVASNVLEALSKAGIEVFPPSTTLIQTVKDKVSATNGLR